MKTKVDWIAAVVAEQTTLGLIDFIRKDREGQDRAGALPPSSDRPMKFGLDEVCRSRQTVRAGPVAKKPRPTKRRSLGIVISDRGVS